MDSKNPVAVACFAKEGGDPVGGGGMPIGCSCGRSVVTVALTGWRRILFFPVLGSTTVARLVWITMGSGMLSELGEDGGGEATRSFTLGFGKLWTTP